MEDASGLRWYNTVHQISEQIVRIRGPSGFVGQFELSLFMLYKIYGGLRALNLDEDTCLADIEWHIDGQDSEWAVFDELIGIICIIARLNAK